ncbi:hypothetical protein HJC23_000567 [Cyclotella cryptica]|uniref:Phosphofructokinase domain-containing protein n=1 Tax=Cyclotella cryptica TaxID=29204 RepID=A0ABD3PTJ3_9STRA
MMHMNVAMMTSGGLAPCLASSVAYLIEFWAKALKEGKISGLTLCMYIDGYKGLLTEDSTVISPDIYDECTCLHDVGGSPIGNSRVKIALRVGLSKKATPHSVAAQQLLKDSINVIHTIGGDDTNTQAAELSKYLLEKHGGKVSVFRQPRMLIIHEVMGRDSGYLTAATARKYREMYSKTAKFPAPGFTTTRMSRDVHAVWIPEVQVNIAEEGARLKKIMDEHGCEVPRDAFGHVKLDKINPGVYFSKRLASLVGAEKTLVQKSGYFARSAASNALDRKLIRDCAGWCAERLPAFQVAWDRTRTRKVNRSGPSSLRGSKDTRVSTPVCLGSKTC